MLDLIDSVLCAFVIVVLFLVIGLAVYISPLGQQYQCDQFAAVNAHLEIKYVFPVGCMVKTPNGTWVQSGFVNQYAPVNVDVK